MAHCCTAGSSTAASRIWRPPKTGPGSWWWTPTRASRSLTCIHTARCPACRRAML
ncbi:unnamed protein product [Effrenium voratum]|nr:unnamed protein product [Effrenium voratum]CAJ1450339.1 unnamed protein product [Effrenium voratum]